MLFISSPKEKPGQPRESAPEVSDLDLAERSATGDRLAFETIYRRHVNRVYGLCLRLTADPVAADTLTQDTFIKAWTSMGGYTGRGNLGGWLARIAVNLQRDQFRQLARREKLAEESGRLYEERQVHSGSVVPLLTAMDLDRGIAQLPAGARTVFVLSEVEGYAQREIAALMNVATGTVKAQLHRARRLLRDILSENKGIGS
jgi:RNA polymerase sigma-70 factor (ECF subfamily)